VPARQTATVACEVSYVTFSSGSCSKSHLHASGYWHNLLLHFVMALHQALQELISAIALQQLH
jgi:hexokinase